LSLVQGSFDLLFLPRIVIVVVMIAAVGILLRRERHPAFSAARFPPLAVKTDIV